MIRHVMGIEGTYPLLLVVWLAPLVGAICCAFAGPVLKRGAGWLASASVGVAFVAALLSWADATAVRDGAVGAHQALFAWTHGIRFGLLLDPLALVWVLVITGVGFLIHLYSIGYMAGDRLFARFFAYMNLFVFAMLTLVLSDDFVGLLIGWGLVGLASYLLIGFWFERPSAVAAARKAFVINVVGDVAIMLAIFIMIARIGSAGFGDVFAAAPSLGNALFPICIFLFIGAAAKSAQVPLHTWLPDAMEGPTPVSALIHAATMVTAGVYLVARCAPLWNASSDAQLLVGTVGGLTALLGAILGTSQWDIKRILAYSTMSQIGYMIMGVGVGAYAAGVAHFLMHAFFKALLFLGAGIVIHTLAGEQDIRRMGGLRQRMPLAFWGMLAGVLAICGIPGFSGFFSKDAVIQGALDHGHPWLYGTGIVAAGITAYYMFRMFLVAFAGEFRGSLPPARLGFHPEVHAVHGHDEAEHPPAWIMGAPVALLTIPSVAAGWIMAGRPSPWERLMSLQFAVPAHLHAPLPEAATSALVLVMVAAGIGIAWVRYGGHRSAEEAADRLRAEAAGMPAILRTVFYFDVAIDALIVRPAQALGTFAARVLEPHVVDGTVREVVHVTRWFGDAVRSFQTGLVRAYVVVVVAGVACVLLYYVLVGGMTR